MVVDGSAGKFGSVRLVGNCGEEKIVRDDVKTANLVTALTKMKLGKVQGRFGGGGVELANT